MKWAELKRLADRRVVAAVIVGLAVLIGYQVWVQRQTHRTATAVKVAKRADAKATTLTKVQCANTRLFYRLFNALAEDSSPAFGSPPDGPIVPGARARLIGQLYAAERVASAPLRRQGCTIKVPPAP
jgi:hypothetical protein